MTSSSFYEFTVNRRGEFTGTGGSGRSNRSRRRNVEGSSEGSGDLWTRCEGGGRGREVGESDSPVIPLSSLLFTRCKTLSGGRWCVTEVLLLGSTSFGVPVGSSPVRRREERTGCAGRKVYPRRRLPTWVVSLHVSCQQVLCSLK